MKIVLLLLFSSANLAYGQTFEAKYNADITTGNGELWSGTTTLVFDDTSAAFTMDDWATESALLDTDDNTIVWIDPDSEGMKIYTNFNLGIQKYKVSHGSPKSWNFIFVEDIPKIDWSISAKRDTIGGVEATKATGLLRRKDVHRVVRPIHPQFLRAVSLHRFTGLNRRSRIR